MLQAIIWINIYTGERVSMTLQIKLGGLGNFGAQGYPLVIKNIKNSIHMITVWPKI